MPERSKTFGEKLKNLKYCSGKAQYLCTDVVQCCELQCACFMLPDFLMSPMRYHSTAPQQQSYGMLGGEGQLGKENSEAPELKWQYGFKIITDLDNEVLFLCEKRMGWDILLFNQSSFGNLQLYRFSAKKKNLLWMTFMEKTQLYFVTKTFFFLPMT